MTIKKTMVEKINSDEIFIKEFFGSTDVLLRKNIQSTLDLFQDKWSVRFILLAYYFLGKKANEMITRKVRDYGYSFVDKFKMKNWSYFGGNKDEELNKYDSLQTGREGARNLPNKLGKEGILMQNVGNNKKLTPLGKNVCKYLHFKFLKENKINLKVLSDLYNKSEENLSIFDLPDSFPENLDLSDCLDLGILSLHEDIPNNYKLSSKFLKLFNFLLEHPYIDFESSNVLKTNFIKILHRSVINRVKECSKDSPIVEELLSLEKIQDIIWIYQLDLKYKSKANYKKWFSALFTAESTLDNSPNGFILQSEPGTGKTIWMLQQVCKLLNQDYMTVIPVFISLRDFAIREINEKQYIFFQDINLIEFSEKSNDHKKIYNFWSRLLSIAIRERGSELWGKAFIKLFLNSNFLLFGDGWDELTPNLKDFLTQFILTTIRSTKFKLKYIFSTRYLERSLSNLIENYNREDNVIKLKFPTKDQVIKYLEIVDINWVKADDEKAIIEKRFGKDLTPMSLWLLSLFPNFKNLPQNSAELYDRWIKFEALREISDKLKERFGTLFQKTIRGIKNYKDLDALLDLPYIRKIDGMKFPLMQYIIGPIPGIIKERRGENKEDYGLLKLLPKLVYNRLLNNNYFYNYHEIIQMNPLFNRFIRCYNDEKNRPNFVLINSHYDYYLAALHCFQKYLDGKIFDFLEKVDKKKGLDSDYIERIVYQSNPSSLIKYLFLEILDIKPERRENDSIQNVGKDLILIRNVYDSIPKFNDQAIGYPLNQNGPFIFKLKTRNFIDSHYQQVYKFYWNNFLKQNGHLPKKRDLEKFKNVQKSVINNERTIRNLFKNILEFQDIYHNNKETTKLADLCYKVDIKTPHLIPIIIYAFELSQNEKIPTNYISQLEKSEFIALPWIKLWVYRAIIRKYPERITELCNYALKHTKPYLLKFCALNIINPLKKEIGKIAFDLSLQLFERVSNKYKEIIIFMWSSHLLTKEQLKTIKNREKDLHYLTTNKIIFDLQYLLILHGILPNHFNSYDFDQLEIPPKKTLTFLINLYKSSLVSKEDFPKFFFHLPLKSLIFIHRILLQNDNDLFSKDEIEQILTPKFKELALNCCDTWWKKNTPYNLSNLMEMLEEMKNHFLSKGHYKEIKEFEKQEFRLKKYLENLIVLPDSEKKQIYTKGKEILKTLLIREEKSSSKFLPITYLKNFYDIFYEWLVNWGNNDILIEFYLEFKDDFDFDDFFFLLLNKVKKKIFNELFPTVQQNIKKNPRNFLLNCNFDSHRRSHPSKISRNSIFEGFIKFKLIINMFSEDELYDLLLKTYDLSNNDDLLNYVYNLCNIGSDLALKKIARLWDENYVDINKNYIEDPSFYIWCGIPYELLDKIYPFLLDPIAKIFFIVCLSIRDRFKPYELGEKHSIKNKNGIVYQSLKTFKQNELAEALTKFLKADWSFLYFKVLCSYIELTPLLLKCIVKSIGSGGLSISSIIESRFKSKKKGKIDFQTQNFNLNSIEALGFCNEVMEYYNSIDKVAIFTGLLNSDNFQAIVLASDFWENYENLAKELRALPLEKIEEKILKTNNFTYIKKLKQAINLNIRKIKDINELSALSRSLLRIEKIIKRKIDDSDKIENYDIKSIGHFFNEFEYNLKQIKEKQLELEASNSDLEQFLEILKKKNTHKKRFMMNARFPLIYSRKIEKSVLWNKIDELNLLKQQVIKNDDIKDLIIKKIQDYQGRKDDFLKNPEKFNHNEIIQELVLDHKVSDSQITNLIIKELNIDLRVSNTNLKLFLTNLKTPKAKKRAFYYMVDSCLKQRKGNTSRYKVNKAEFKKIINTIKAIFENFLNPLEMDDILSAFTNRIKGDVYSTVNHYQNNDSIEINDYNKANNILNERSHSNKRKSEEELEKHLLSKDVNIPFIEKNLKYLGDGFDFTSFLSLLLEESESNYHQESLYYKISSYTRKKLQKYLFYWILKQRERFQDNLSHDSIAIADESNQISDIDAGIFVDNLFEEVFIESIASGFFPNTLNYLKEKERSDLYDKIKLFTLLQMEPGIEDVIRVQSQGQLRLKIPINKTISKAMSEEEIKWSIFLYFATHFYNVIQIQLFDLPQFLNGFKLRKKITEYD
ncbi:hypothetical protein LCGC14_0578820 [marine sediment metagenome]|uniref:Uncharacterized protein n=1 Tax=marine sediment metagenome TaxID=412755 RepID=A0A0F9RH38_9ZZZZ